MYTEENFAYGSTPLSTWLALIRGCPELAAEMKRLSEKSSSTAAPPSAATTAADDDGGSFSSSSSAGYVVWGSSSGWLVFYAAVGLGVKSAWRVHLINKILPHPLHLKGFIRNRDETRLLHR